MKSLSLLLLGLTLAAQAQQPGATAPQDPYPETDDQQKEAPERPSGEEAPETPPKSMTVDDARDNIDTVIESFITEHSPRGYWPLKQKSTGKLLKLKLDKTLPNTVRKVSEGHFSTQALLKDAATGASVKTEFLVDFSGTVWKVERLSLLSVSGPAKAGKKAASAQGQ